MPLPGFGDRIPVLWFDNHARGIVMKKNKGIGVAIRFPCERSGAGGRIRTAYLLITNQLLYRLSYAGPDYQLTGRGERDGRLRFSSPPA